MKDLIKKVKNVSARLSHNDDMLQDIIGEILQDLENNDLEMAKSTFHWHACSDVIRTDDYNSDIMDEIGEIIW